jgi:hypothetical protein
MGQPFVAFEVEYNSTKNSSQYYFDNQDSENCPIHLNRCHIKKKYKLYSTSSDKLYPARILLYR